ncbi:MAG: DUF3037 domain-containing protein [Candidatus Sericytochromatia bacterium]
MINYKYQILRYTHDQMTGEFVNVGLVLYSDEHKYLRSKFINKFSRLSNFFPDINGHHLIKTLKHLEDNFLKINDFYSKDIEQITSLCLPKDNAPLYFSDIKAGFMPPLKSDAKNILDHVFDNLFERLITHYFEEKEDRKDDSYVWKKLYKQYFDEFNITNKLKKHVIHTKTDDIKFDKSWKNGVWHCYQPLSFDLKNQEKIKNKAYQWESILRELDTSGEKVNVYLLTSLSDNKESNNFVMSKLKDMELNNVEVKFVQEKQASELALSVKQAMEESEKGKQKI